MDNADFRRNEIYRGQRARNEGEKFKMLTVRLSFSAATATITTTAATETPTTTATGTVCPKTLANEATDNGQAKKKRTRKLRYKQSKGHFANGLTFEQVWGSNPHSYPQAHVAEVVPEALLTALKLKQKMTMMMMMKKKRLFNTYVLLTESGNAAA